MEKSWDVSKRQVFSISLRSSRNDTFSRRFEAAKYRAASFIEYSNPDASSTFARFYDDAAFVDFSGNSESHNIKNTPAVSAESARLKTGNARRKLHDVSMSIMSVT